MYNGLSNEFLRRMSLPSQRRRIRGTIDNINMSAKNIIQHSVGISNQCSDNNDIMIGQVYTGELKITLKDLNIQKGTYKGREIVLYEGLEVDEDTETYEDILLGHFFIDKPEWSVNGIECVCYDAMSKFDKSMSVTFPTEGAKMYYYIDLACRNCNVTLGMTEQEIQALPNGNEIRKVYKENDMNHYRDLISWCAQSMGTNAIINRQGELVFQLYQGQNASVYTFTEKDRLGTGSKASDFSSFYTGISMVNIEEMVTKYYGLDPDNGSVMNLGSNPLLQKQDQETDADIEVLRRRILNAISIINYTPFKARIHRPMVFDLMDVITLTGGLLGPDNTISCITKFSWSFMGGYDISCSGSDPSLASAKSKTDKNLAGLMSTTAETKEVIDDIGSTVSDIGSTVSDLDTTVTNLDTAVTNVEQTVEQQTTDISGKQNRINFDLQVPTTSSPGEVGDIWIVGTDTPGVSSNGIRLFRCTNVTGSGNNKTYTWVEYALISYGSQDIAVGSALPTGQIYFVYEV